LKIKDELKHLLRRLEQISNDYREKVCSKMHYRVQLVYFGKFASSLNSAHVSSSFHISGIWNITSLFQSPLTQLACKNYCHSSKCPPLARTQARRRTLHQLRYLSKIRAKYLTVPKLRELVTGTHAAGQAVNK